MEIFNLVFVTILAILGSAVRGAPYCGYCSVPCPFLYSAPSPWSYGTAARRPHFIARTTVADNYTDVDEDTVIVEEPSKPPAIKSRAPDPEPTTTPTNPPKPKPKEDTEPSPPKKEKKSPTQPTRRFFTSLFSIPGAVVDTLLSGEIVL